MSDTNQQPKNEGWEIELGEEGTPLARFQKERTNAISEMFDGEDSLGIYPTSRFFCRLDRCFNSELASAKKRGEENMKNKVEAQAQEAGADGRFWHYLEIENLKTETRQEVIKRLRERIVVEGDIQKGEIIMAKEMKKNANC